MCGQNYFDRGILGALFLWSFICGISALFGESSESEKGLFYYVVDRSGSITSYGLKDPIQQAITQHASQLPEDTEVRLVFFSRQASESQRWDRMTDEAKADFAEFFERNFKPEGPTRLYDTVAEVLNEIRASSEEYRFVTVLVFSDGENNWSRSFKSWKQLEPGYDNLVDRHEHSFLYWITMEFDPAEEPPSWVHHLPQPPGTTDIPIPEPPPQAEFAGFPQQLKVGEEIRFEYEPAGGRVNELRWDFGDGSFSEEQEPVHAYEQEGSYTVTLFVSGPGGFAEEVKADYITVTPNVPLTADFRIAPDRIQIGDEVRLQNISGGKPESQEWSVNEQVLSQEVNASFVAEAEGEAVVTLTIWRGEESESATRTLKVLPLAPPAGFEIHPGEAAFGEPIILSAKETRDDWIHTWTIDGEITLEGPEIEWTSDRDGLMRVLHTVEGPGGVSRLTDRIFIHPPIEFVPPTAFSIEPRFYTQGDVITFRAAESHEGWIHEWLRKGELVGSGPEWKWESDEIGNIVITHRIRNLETDAVHEESEEILGRVHDLIQVRFSASKTQGTYPLEVEFTEKSSGEGVAYQWDFGDGNRSNLRNPIHVYEKPGQYEVVLSVTNPQGAVTQNTEPVVLSVVPPMPLWQKIAIGVAAGLIVWVVLIVPLILRPLLAPQKGPRLVGMRTYSLHLIARRGGWRRLFWPKRKISVGSTSGSDVRLPAGTGPRGIVASIERSPAGSQYSIRPVKNQDIYRIGEQASLIVSGVETKSKITRSRLLKDGDVYEIAGERLTWCQPKPRSRKPAKKAARQKKQAGKRTFPSKKQALAK